MLIGIKSDNYSHGMWWNSANPLNLVFAIKACFFCKTGEVTVDTGRIYLECVFILCRIRTDSASAKCVYEEWMMKEIGVAWIYTH